MSRIRPFSARRLAMTSERKALRRRLLNERMFCEARIAGCWQIPTDVHEIVSRARGGSILEEENCLVLCRSCHAFITENPAWGLENGFLLHAHPSDADKVAAQRARLSFTYGLDSGDFPE